MDLNFKYQAFSRTVLREAEDMKNKILEAKDEEFQRLSQAYLQKLEEKYQKQVNFEKDRLEKEKNKQLIEANQAVRKSLTEKRNILTEKLYQAVILQLKEFMASESYQRMLVSEINLSKRIFGKEGFVVLLSKKDMMYKAHIEQETGISVEETDVDILGGAIHRGKNGKMISDFTLDEKIEVCKRNYTFFHITE